MPKAIIHGAPHCGNVRGSLVDVYVEFCSDAENPDFRDGAAELTDVNFSQSQSQMEGQINTKLAAYLSAQTGEDFDANDIRRL